MRHHYHDIRSRVPAEPLWWDEHAVPRYVAFGHDVVANIYAEEVVLALVTCQSCGHEFKVAFSQDAARRVHSGNTLRDLIHSKRLEYGDPPNIECCAAGNTMSSEPRRVLEYWISKMATGEGLGWKRVPEHEVDITPDWVAAEPRA